MLFAAIIDAGLIPFLVFTALISRTEYIEPVNATGHWTTLFGSDGATTKITYSTFLVSVVSGSLHLVSLILSIFLGVVFRKISRLPPDMNPLESNLTSRHKRNKSESSRLNDRGSQATAQSTSSRRDSKADHPLISPPRMVPFMHTRKDSRENIPNVSHPISNPRDSHCDHSETPFYDQPSGHRSSQTNMEGLSYIHALSQRSSRINMQSQYDNEIGHHTPSRTKLQSICNDQAPIEQAPQAIMGRSPTKSSSIYSTSTITTIATSRPASARPHSLAPSMKDRNWMTHPSPSPSPSPSPPRELKHLLNKPSYQPLPQSWPFDYTFNKENQIPKPLEMNPPTPPVQQHKRRLNPEQHPLAPVTGNLDQGCGSSPGTVGVGKARAWGGMGRSGTGTMNGGGRVVSRSGVEVRQGGILPNGGVRAREVSGKIMEEGRGNTGDWT